MKISKLYTLGQFVDLQEEDRIKNTEIMEAHELDSENVDIRTTAAVHAYGKIKKYNQFLKQELKTAMFSPGNKNIFKGLNEGVVDYRIYTSDEVVVYNDGYTWVVNTLDDLARVSNGGIELENVEL